MKYNFSHTGPTTTKPHKPQTQKRGFKVIIDSVSPFVLTIDDEKLWYLREDSLEVQLWAAPDSGAKVCPSPFIIMIVIHE